MGDIEDIGPFNACVIGSTGTIGKKALDIISNEFSSFFKVHSLAFHSRCSEALPQVKCFRPKCIAICDKSRYREFAEGVSLLGLGYKPEILCGSEGVEELASRREHDLVVAAASGIGGLRAASQAVQNAKGVALANKEAVVCGWHILKDEAKKSGCKVVPVDSEHNSIYRLVAGVKKEEISSIMITASGGGLFGTDFAQRKGVTPESAAVHPNWAMGGKISVESSTMANKGLELFEACKLFDLAPEDVNVLIQRDSIVHGGVNFVDGSSSLFASLPDMRLHVAHAMMSAVGHSLPVQPLKCKAVDFAKLPSLEFCEVPRNEYPIFYLAREVAAKRDIRLDIAFNALNDLAVQMFCSNKIDYCQMLNVMQEGILRFEGVRADVSCVSEVCLYVSQVQDEAYANYLPGQPGQRLA